ncbi:MAG: winged helix DNA-binding domain-containing protein [Proteobacteria bacterium]|nr:winged helix DNA-binding domain-containing protein [Pseudomonadota bacterium]MDA1057581.1 winged helix DNA-binding domain-containing protein [Pseudomonadota bacterium]
MSPSAKIGGLKSTRHLAIAAAFAAPGTLGAGIKSLGFVQADPIRSPARAQDLILRQRVNDYRAGDLERHYAALGLEETYLHVYGFAAPALADYLLPRHGTTAPAGLTADVLAFVQARGETHPRDLDAAFGRATEANHWGSKSAAGTRALDWLHFHGHLRVARRESGIRVYAPRQRPVLDLSPQARLEHVVMALARLLNPIPAASLAPLSTQVARGIAGRGARMDAVKPLLARGELRRDTVDGMDFLSPSETRQTVSPPARRVRILAPFDPLLWDRRRVEHLWGWRYRFEAYTPPARRVMGFYAMPILWGDALVGWVNAARRDGALHIETGFRARRPGSAAFGNAFDAEIARLDRFLVPPQGRGKS